jgi:4-amino-4-deoxychorismate lyase
MAVISQGSASCLVNGEPSRCLDVADRGLNYGDGVFTTLPVRQGFPLFLSRHLARLRADAARLGLPFPGVAVLADEARRLAAGHPESVLKILLTRGVGGRGYRPAEHATGTRVLAAHPLPGHPADLREQGVRARVCRLRLGLNPALAGVKHLNRLEQVLARAEWADEAVREGLLLDYEGFLVEGVASNVFIVSQGRLRTPLLDRCGVAGVMRGLVLDEARAAGLAAEEARLRLAEAFEAEELFMTNSLIGVWPVRALEGRRFAPGPVARLLAGRVDALAALERQAP